jgi:hypothetical protein
MNTYQGQLDEHSKEKERVKWSSLEGETKEEGVDKRAFSSEYDALLLQTSLVLSPPAHIVVWL